MNFDEFGLRKIEKKYERQKYKREKKNPLLIDFLKS